MKTEELRIRLTEYDARAPVRIYTYIQTCGFAGLTGNRGGPPMARRRPGPTIDSK